MKNYADMIGRNESNLLSTASKQFYIYLGRIGNTENENTVKSFLEKQLKNINIGDKIKDINLSNLKELNTENTKRTFKSFLFSVDYLDKKIVNNKDIWPIYSEANKYKLPKAEWLKISENFTKKSIPQSQNE